MKNLSVEGLECPIAPSLASYYKQGITELNFNNLMIDAKHSQEPADIATSSDDYARRFSGVIGKWLLEVQSNYFSLLVSPLKAKSALDVGGGHGQLVEPLAKLGVPVVILGSDERCKSQIGTALGRNHCSFKMGPLTQIPETDSAYELVTCIRFISHCDDWQKLIAELCRVASRGVLIDYPPLISGNLFAPITFRIKKLIEGNTRPFSIFTHHEIQREFLRHGFVLKDRQGLFFFPMAIHRLLKNPRVSSFLENIAQTIGLRRSLGSPTLALFVPQ